jgi:isoaspartyl peptidase/L-asparaginase-like protein (Ntn-hydrolase superfamily)
MAKSEYLAGTIVLEIKFSDFTKCSRQIPCSPAVKSASEIEKTAISLCREVMEQNPNRGIRLIGVRAVKLLKKEELPPEQLSLSDLIRPSYQKDQKLRKTLDMIRDKYGDRAIHKGEIPHPDNGNHNP